MFENGAYRPDSGKLVPNVTVLPLTPVVSLAPFGQLEVSISVDDVPPDEVVPPELLLGGLAVERLPPHADETSATTTRQTATPRGRARCRRRTLRRSFMGDVLSVARAQVDTGAAGAADLVRRGRSVRRL